MEYTQPTRDFRQDRLHRLQLQETADSLNKELVEKANDIKQHALASLVVCGIDIEEYDQQLTSLLQNPELPHALSLEINFLATAVALFENPALDVTTESEAARLATYRAQKAWATGHVKEKYGPEFARPLCELYDEFLPLDFSAVELMTRSTPEAA